MNLRTLGDMKKESGGDKKESGKKTESYTGGESSGMAVVNPDVASLMEKAEKNSKSREEFTKEEKEKDGSVCKITLYKNGFRIDDGDFNDYSDEENKKFMAELNKQLIPKRLKQKYPKGGLSVSLDYRTEETYTPPPPPAYTAFSGAGTSLSGVTKPPANKFGKKKGYQENFIIEPDRKRNITTIQIRLGDGQRIAVEVNLDTNLHDVYNHVSTVSGVMQFELYGGFPPKPLNLDSTIEQSDLADSTLIQKM